MKCLNFDDQFQQYMQQWVQENAALYGNSYDRMEEKMPEVYIAWLNTPAPWLSGQTPGTYFAQFDDAAALLAWMRQYFEQKIPVPDQLLERVVDLGTAAENGLCAMLEDDSAPHDARLTAITLLSEMQSVKPLQTYLNWIKMRAQVDERADMAAQALAAMGRRVVAPALAATEGATESGLDTLADILTHFPGEEAIFTLAMTLFAKRLEQRALFASMLGRLGDVRAAGALRVAMEDPALNYLDYIELRNALEALGEDAPPERSFDGDPYYESLRCMD